ncbi:Zinc finger BED domain-containing [Pleurotus pulmonarius]
MASDQCAVGIDGHLLDASQINFYNDPDDALPISGPDMEQGRGHRIKAIGRFKESITSDQLDEDGNPVQKPARSQPRRSLATSKQAKKQTAKTKDADAMAVDSDDEDDDFTPQCSDRESNDDSLGEISNGELADNLPTKLARKAASNPTTRSKAAFSNKRKGTDDAAMPAKSRRVAIEDTDDDDDSANVLTAPLHKSKRQNPVYCFYEEFTPEGEIAVGSKYFKCCHTGKVCQITAKMNHSLNGLVNNLKNHVPHMYKLYEAIKERGGKPTEEEKAIASGKTTLTAEEMVNFLKRLQKSDGSIAAAFVKQVEKAKGPFNQQVFEKLLVEWIVACDQPFEEVERPELRRLLEYTHHSFKPLHVPHRTTIKTRVMKMGEDTVKQIRDMFAELKGKISISLDAWTSSNHYAFLAIVAHYVTNDGQLQELLIGFQEINGEHSGENLAEVVWETLVKFGLTEKVIAFVMDNASNNDTMVKALEADFKSQGIIFSARHSRLRCMPHTIHLAALKLLEGVGAISKSEGRQASSRGGDYQEVVSLPLGDESNDGTLPVGDGSTEHETRPEDGIPHTLERLRKIVRAVRVSPQRRSTWLRTVAESLSAAGQAPKPLMLILDVRTRWTSTHQMLRRALDHKDCLNDWVDSQREIRHLEIEPDAWSSVALLADWLQAFRDATNGMSSTSFPMLSTIHATFRGLQDHIKSILRSLPDETLPQMKRALVEAHEKLAEYYDRFDESPFYTWAALLDPRIGYMGVEADYQGDSTLEDYLAKVKDELKTYFTEHYKDTASPPSREGSSTSITSQATTGGKYDFTSRYKQRDRPPTDELEEFWRLEPQDFDACNPIEWWYNHRLQFPNLYQLAMDILSIPGSAVAVERVFSGGRDTISMRRSSLRADTISSLMLMKHYIRLNRTVS